MDEIRQALALGRRVDLIWAPCKASSISLTKNWGHHSVDTFAELDFEIAQFGLPTMAFIGAADYVYVKD